MFYLGFVLKYPAKIIFYIKREKSENQLKLSIEKCK